jgi:hypothetical protein
MVAFASTPLLGINLQQIYTPPPASNPTPYELVNSNPFTVGQEAEGPLNAKYLWVLAEEDLALYDAVAVDEAGTASQLTSTEAALAWKIGVVSQAAIADGSYGWIQTRGTATVFVQPACAADTRLVSTATAGALDDSTTVGVIIKGIVATATNTLTVKAAVSCYMAVEPFADIPAIA